MKKVHIGQGGSLMNQYTTLLEESLEAWHGARIEVIDELKNIPAKHFDFRPVKSVRSIRELAIHILEVALMMTGELSRTDTNFHRASWPDLLKMYANKAYRLTKKDEIIDLLRSSLEDGIRRFRSAGELHMLQFIERFDGKPGTRLAWLQHGISQELYHCGQITTYARLLGLVPALTRKIQES
jgi:uncharacterized damage-inducible protein DinB